MKTQIYIKGEWYYMGLLERIQEGKTYLPHCGTHTFVAGVCPTAVHRHPITPVDPDDKHAVAMKIGLEAYDAYHLEKYPGRVLGIMRKRDRPVGVGYIGMGAGKLRGENIGRHLDQFCIAIAPEPVEKTTEDHLRDLLNAVDRAILTASLREVAAVAKAHLQKHTCKKRMTRARSLGARAAVMTTSRP